tara:strand:+ start:308 stop:493 length:186 start_codon:yes stop_codon:yes gene_type:complete
VLGSSGEFPLLSEHEKEEALGYVGEEVRASATLKSLPLIAGVGCPSTDLTIERCRSAASLG